MDPIGLPIASSVAGTNQAERASAKASRKAESKKAADRFRRLLDDVDLTVSEGEAADAVRNPKGNQQEESREDRQGSAHYDVQGVVQPKEQPKLDLEG